MPDRGDARFDKCQLTAINNERFHDDSFRTRVYRYIKENRGITIEKIVAFGHPLSDVRYCVKSLCADGKINIEGWEVVTPRTFNFRQLSRNGETTISVLDKIKPIEKTNLIDLVHAAGIDTNDWANYGGNKPPSQNPRYCYEWSFIDQNNIVVLNLWHNNFTEESGKIYQRLNIKVLANQFTGVRLSRLIKLCEAIEFAFTENLHVRVIICLSEDGSFRTVDKRVLDTQPWAVTYYDKNIGQCTLVRGNRNLKFIDQFSLQEPIVLEEPRKRDVTGTAFCRSADVRRKALERAQGNCEYCGTSGFKMVNNEIYIETHHIIPLSENGPDNISNVAALCPNHHREAHHGQNRKEIQGVLMSKFSGR
jgi:5-methylcytosine-specific restriction enzyme A